MGRNFLSESPFYQDILAEGEAGGIEKGLAKGREEGRVEGVRGSLIAVAKARFPSLSRLVLQLIKDADDIDMLQDMILRVSAAKTAEEARVSLSELFVDEEEEE